MATWHICTILRWMHQGFGWPHVKVRVNKEAKNDHINRKGDVTINVCAIVDMDGRFTYVGVGMTGSVNDMSVLKECWEEPNFPHPPTGE